jgi:hypothetical protein
VDTNNTLGIFSRAESRRKRAELAYPPDETELIAESQVKELGAFIKGVLPGILSLLGNATIQVSLLACLSNIVRTCRRRKWAMDWSPTPSSVNDFYVFLVQR